MENIYSAWNEVLTGEPGPEVEKWTVDDFVRTYKRNVTDGYNFVRIANDGEARTKFATFGDFIRDPSFDLLDATVYFNHNTSEAWLSTGGNKLYDNLKNYPALGTGESADEAMRVLGYYGANSLIDAPRYKKTEPP